MAVHQGLLFQRLRWQLWRNTVHLLLRRGQVRALTVFLCSALVWGSVFALSYIGFNELRDRWDFPLKGKTIGLLFDLLFVALTVLLTFSTAIILYSSLFSSAESAFLLATPAPPDQLFA